ncbi:MAG: PAS domain S-box protein [Deltaproteobacteria bacterium]|nr:PAS domain S-box protein [Deltaproteobacteria bacterium]
MAWPYEYNPYLLTILAPLLFLVFLGVHCLRNKTVPGAAPFIILIALTIPWLIANALQLSSTDEAARIFWFKFDKALVLPMASAGLCFVMAYAGLSKWLTRRVTILLVIVALTFALLILTNETHHFVWKRIFYDGAIRVDFGPAHWGAIAYGFALSLAQLTVLIWLFLRSPRHRWIAAGLILSVVLTRAAGFLNISDNNPFKPLNPVVLASNITFLLYAFAFFRLHMFGVVPVARNMVIDRMTEAMIVLDAQKHIGDLNETAETMLGLPRGKLIGRRVESALQDFPELLAIIHNSHTKLREISFANPHSRWYQVSISPLSDRQGFLLGHLIWMQDTTEQKRIQEQILDHQRTEATLKERELLARELHDGIGQILAAAQLQICSASQLLARGETNQVALYLQRLSDIVQEAKESVRTYLVGVKVLSPAEKSYLEVLRNYLAHYSQKYEVRTELVVASEVRDRHVDAGVAAQLQPIIQEALTNVRRHGKASLARVFLAAGNNHLSITIEDDGQGFDTEAIAKHHAFGLRSMRGRAESAGGGFEVSSTPGKGTRVSVQVPWPKETA